MVARIWCISMMICTTCQGEVKRIWKCKCQNSLNDVKIDKLQPTISKLGGWANFLHFIKVSIEEIESPAPKTLSIEIPDQFEPNLDAAMKLHILRVLHLHEGNKTAAADALGISVKTIYNKLESWNLLETMRTIQ